MERKARVGCMMLGLLMLLGAFIVVGSDTATAAQDGDYTYTIIGNPAVATITGYTGAGGAISIPSTLGGYPTAHIGIDAFDYITSITSVIMPDSVISIDDQAFQFCTSLVSVTMGSGLTTIRGFAFDHCTSLASVVLPNSLTAIGDSAFANCANMQTATLGFGVSSIGMAAFYACSNLTSIVFHGMVAPTYVGAFWIQDTNPAIRGHAYATSNFPAPASQFYGLTMGAVIAAEPVVPGTPTNLNATSGDSQVILSWQEPASDGGSVITGYNVYRSLSSGGTYSIIASPVEVTYTDIGLTNGQTYYYKVSAMNAIGEGPSSIEASATPATTPSAPTLSSASPGNAQIVLVWSAPLNDGGSAIAGYRIYRGQTSGSEVLLTTLGNVLTVTDVPLINGQTYYYKVSAMNSLGEGPLSNEASATPDALLTAPSAPTAAQVSVGDGKLTISWASPSDPGSSAVLGYKLYRGVSIASMDLITTVSGNSYVDSGLTNGQRYYYKVSAYNSAGDGEFTDVLEGTPATGGSTSPDSSLVYLIVGIGAIAIVAAGVIYMMRRKRAG